MPTFGYTTIGASGSAQVNSLRTTITASGDSGTLTNLSGYIKSPTSTNTAIRWHWLIYDATSRVDYSAEFAGAVPATFTLYTSIVAIGSTFSNQDYYLGFLMKLRNDEVVAFDTIGSQLNTQGVTYSYSPPATWTPNTAGSRKYTIYATYTPAGGGTAWSKSLTDSITPTDSLLKAPVKKNTETTIVLDQLTTDFSGGKFLTPSDSVTISDSLIKTLILGKTDSVVTSESLAKAVDLAKTETVTPSEAISKRPILNKTETIISSDQVTLPSTFSLADTVNVSEVLSRTVTYHLTISDSATINDLISTNQGTPANTYMIYESGTWKLIVNGSLAQQFT